MKLVIAVVDDRDQNRVTDALMSSGFKFTCIGSTSGLLHESNKTLLISTEDAEVDRVMEIIEGSSRTREQFLNVMQQEAAPGSALPAPMKVQIGGAVCFVVNVEAVQRF